MVVDGVIGVDEEDARKVPAVYALLEACNTTNSKCVVLAGTLLIAAYHDELLRQLDQLFILLHFRPQTVTGTAIRPVEHDHSRLLLLCDFVVSIAVGSPSDSVAKEAAERFFTNGESKEEALRVMKKKAKGTRSRSLMRKNKKP